MNNTDFITLHGNKVGRPYKVNPNHISYFVESHRQDNTFTEVCFLSGTKIHVSESPDTIYNLINSPSI